MPLVFVHGINVRRGEGAAAEAFDNRMKTLAAQFRATSFADRVTAPDGLRVFTPYWGDLGATFARNLASLPQTGVQMLAGGDDATATVAELTAAHLDGPTVLGEADAGTQPLLTLARARSLSVAVDLLVAGAGAATVDSMLFPGGLDEAREGAARFARRATEYAAANPRPGWLAEVGDDDAFLDRLFAEVEADAPPASTSAASGVQTLGFGDGVKSFFQNAVGAVRDAAGKVVGAARNAVGGVAVDGSREGFLWLSSFARPTVSTFLGRFMGDIFTYMENRDPIRDRVLEAIDEALAARRPGDDALYLVGHSFGGILLYDILSHFRPDLECPLFVTVGSQVAVFAELNRLADKAGVSGAFAVSKDSVIPRPNNVARWVNIFDRTDILGFGTRGVFGGAWDFEFETDALPLLSHGAYFDSVRFHARLRKRVAQAFSAPDGTDGPPPKDED